MQHWPVVSMFASKSGWPRQRNEALVCLEIELLSMRNCELVFLHVPSPQWPPRISPFPPAREQISRRSSTKKNQGSQVLENRPAHIFILCDTLKILAAQLVKNEHSWTIDLWAQPHRMFHKKTKTTEFRNSSRHNPNPTRVVIGLKVKFWSQQNATLTSCLNVCFQRVEALYTLATFTSDLMLSIAPILLVKLFWTFFKDTVILPRTPSLINAREEEC